MRAIREQVLVRSRKDTLRLFREEANNFFEPSLLFKKEATHHEYTDRV